MEFLLHSSHFRPSGFPDANSPRLHVVEPIHLARKSGRWLCNLAVLGHAGTNSSRKRIGVPVAVRRSYDRIQQFMAESQAGVRLTPP